MASAKLERKTRLFVYTSHFLSAWGDRMWSFGVGLFLINMASQDLRLVAIYGFSSGGSSLLLGALVGDWVDRTGRLKAAQVALIIQNLAVAVCSVLVFFVFLYHADIKSLWPEEGFADLCYAIIIVIAIISNLASLARKIAVEKDWIVEICGRDKDMLATMTSKLRAIDLSTAILSPIATGQIISFTAVGYGALTIAGWNLLSVVVEYYLILKVYETVPALRNKANKGKDVELTENLQNNEDNPDEAGDELSAQPEDKPSHEPAKHPADTDSNTVNEVEKSKKSCFSKMFVSFITLHRGWKTYIKYDVAFAGLGLAMLYMTVLGFDNITVGFAYSQGVPEWVLGILMALGSLSGITGTFAYPRIRRSIGLERTGLIGLGSEILTLSLCVASVWAPGSPFDVFYYHHKSANEVQNCTQTTEMSPVDIIPLNSSSASFPNLTFDINNSSANHNRLCNMTAEGAESLPESYISVSLLMGGIILARFGLWVADLTITQLFLQSVVEAERGIVNGVQDSLNKLMDMLKFLLVILVPQEELFGFLIIVSFFFICLGWVFYAIYSRSVRGHLFHFDKFQKCLDSENNNTTRNETVSAEAV